MFTLTEVVALFQLPSGGDFWGAAEVEGCAGGAPGLKNRGLNGRAAISQKVVLNARFGYYEDLPMEFSACQFVARPARLGTD